MTSVLMIMTNNHRLGNTNVPSGAWAEEIAAPLEVFDRAGISVTLASPQGGPVPLDPMSLLDAYRSPVVDAFLASPQRRIALDHTVRVAELDATSFDALFIVGGFGVRWDLVGDATVLAQVASAATAGLPIAAVCHGPAVLANVRVGPESLMRGRRATGFSNAEEDAVSNGAVYPVTVENALRSAGAEYTAAGGIFGPSVVVDGKILTGQNPASSAALAAALVEVLA
ncbi:MAG: type 1 glutamine amidotransferase domain-containing protein [Gemmatimonadaceae bacterium]